MQAGVKKPRLLAMLETYDELQNQLEREQEEKESYRLGCIEFEGMFDAAEAAKDKLQAEFEGMLDAAEAAKDKLEAEFDAQVEVKYVGIIFMHCDTL